MTDKDNTIKPSTLWIDFKAGHKSAYSQLLEQYYPLLRNYGMRLIYDETFIEDCLQDFFIELWQKRSGLSDIENVKAYLLLSFRRRLFREKEKKIRQNNSIELSDNYDFSIEFDVETKIISLERDSENHKKLKKHLENLTKRQREAIYLRFYQSLDYAEIAEIMSINQHSAVNLVYDALRLMRKNWYILLVIAFLNFF